MGVKNVCLATALLQMELALITVELDLQLTLYNVFLAKKGVMNVILQEHAYLGVLLFLQIAQLDVLIVLMEQHNVWNVTVPYFYLMLNVFFIVQKEVSLILSVDNADLVLLLARFVKVMNNVRNVKMIISNMEAPAQKIAQSEPTEISIVVLVKNAHQTVRAALVQKNISV